MRKVFEYEQVLSDFFQKYGSLVVCEDTRQSIWGVLTPLGQIAGEGHDIRFEQVGFLPRKEYQLILPSDCRFLQRGKVLSIHQKQFRVLSTENYYLAGKLLYQKGYCCEVRRDLSDSKRGVCSDEKSDL